MKVDVDKIAAQVARDRAAAKAREAKQRDVVEDRRDRRRQALQHRLLSKVQFSPTLEGRLLASLLCDPAVLALCDAVEVEDFFSPHHRVVFRALRNLQAKGLWVWTDAAGSFDAIADEIERVDAAEDRHERDKVDDLFLLELLARHMHETYGPPGAPIAAWVEHDARKLRELAEGRRAL